MPEHFKSHVPVDLTQAKARYAGDKEAWDYVLDTFWQLNDEQMCRLIGDARSLKELMRLAQIERGGMVAT